MRKKTEKQLLQDIDALAVVRTCCAIVQVCLVALMLLHGFKVI